MFSNTLQEVGEGMELVGGDWKMRVVELKKQRGKDIWLFGGAALTTSFMNEGLVDELFLAVHPIVLRAGKPLLQHIEHRINLTLVDSKTYSTGLVSLTYRVGMMSN